MSIQAIENSGNLFLLLCGHSVTVVVGRTISGLSKKQFTNAVWYRLSLLVRVLQICTDGTWPDQVSVNASHSRP